MRPHLSFGTVEVRICDAQATAGESEALAALITACVAQAARDVDEGRPHADLPPRLIEENMWRAIRYGLDGELLDLDRGEAYPARRAVDRLLDLDRAGAARARPRGRPAVEANGAQRQRALLAQGTDARPRRMRRPSKSTRATYAGNATVMPCWR